jgi:hypothetical protein
MRNTHNLPHILLKLRNTIYYNRVRAELVTECSLSVLSSFQNRSTSTEKTCTVSADPYVAAV